MTKFNDIVANELARRVRKLSTADLLAIAKNDAATVRKPRAASKSGTHRLNLPARMSVVAPEGERPVVTIAEAIMKAASKARKPMSTGDIVSGAMEIRKDAQEATIRAEISKLTSNGYLLRQGPRVGGTYTPSPQALAKTG